MSGACTLCGSPTTEQQAGLFQVQRRCTKPTCGWTVTRDARAGAPPAVQVAAGKAARDDGRQRASRAAGGTWNHQADAALLRLARARSTVTPDDLRAELERTGTHVWRPNAVGAVFSRARDAGTLADTGRSRPSGRAAARRRKVTIWRSLVQGASQQPLLIPERADLD